MRKPTVYIAGPFVFLDPPEKAERIARRKVEICAGHGLEGLAPCDTALDLSAIARPEEKAMAIYLSNMRMMLAADAIVADLTPFRSPSADAGTVFELGFFAGLRAASERGGGARAPRIFAYSNSGVRFAARTGAHVARVPDPLPTAVEDFGEMPDNLMLPCSVVAAEGTGILVPGGGRELALDDLALFEEIVRVAADRLRGGA